MDKILITGVAGFIGSHLAEELLKTHKIVGADNLSLGTEDNIKHLIKNPDFNFYECDILNQKEFENIFRIHSFKTIFHLAGNSDISKGDPQQEFKDTFSTTCVVLEKCRIRGIKEIVFTSSGAVYGDRNEAMRETSMLSPISPYGAAKMSSEAFISAYSNMYGIQSWILRFPNVIGERMTHGVLVDWEYKHSIMNDTLTVLGDGNQQKPYMYVKELIDALLFVWQNAKDRVNYYNISGSGYTKIKNMAKWYAEKRGIKNIIYGNTDRGWNGDAPIYKCDTSKLRELGWATETKSDDAVKKTIELL